MKKIITIIAIFILYLISVTYAANENWDCDLLFSKDKILSNWNEDNVENLVKAMPKESLEKAFENLNKYCCDTEMISINCSGTNDNTLYPESLYIFDHILDIYLRRLDAKEENDNWGNLLYNLEPDSLGKEWRDFITEYGNDINGSLPLMIKYKYDIFWTWSRDVTAFIDNYDLTKDNRKDSINSQIQKYDDWTLYDKYNLACDTVLLIVENYLISAKWLWNAEYNSCKNLTNARIDNENTYVQAILMQKANKLLWSNVESYLSVYFVHNKLFELEQLLFDINTSFTEINKWITKLIPNCS